MLGGGYIKIVGGVEREGEEAEGVASRMCTCNLIERYERGSWCGGEGLTPVRRRGGVCWESSALACWHNGTRGPLWTWKGGGHLDTDCWWTEVTGERGEGGRESQTTEVAN